MTLENRHVVFIPTTNVDQVMPMVRTLRDMGLVQGIDFDFAYQQDKFDWMENIWIHRAGVTFYMRDEKWVTFLRMKFSDNLHNPGE